MPHVLRIFTQNLFESFDLHRIWARPFEHNKASKSITKSRILL